MSVRITPSGGPYKGWRTTGWRAAAASSRRRTGVVYGALRATSGSSARLPQDLGDDLGEMVQRLLGLGLGRLDQQRLVDDQREVHGRRMHAVVEQPLGEVERPDPELAASSRAPDSTNSCMQSRS